MVGQLVANFDLLVWVALGLFVAGVLAALIYDNSVATLKPKHRKQQNPPDTSTSD
jgi:hypothetical protein